MLKRFTGNNIHHVGWLITTTADGHGWVRLGLLDGAGGEQLVYVGEA